MTDWAKIALDTANDDHKRGCNGRYYECDCGYDAQIDSTLRACSAQIATLTAENARLREALKPLADGVKHYEDSDPHQYVTRCFSVSELRRATKALEVK